MFILGLIYLKVKLYHFFWLNHTPALCDQKSSLVVLPSFCHIAQYYLSINALILLHLQKNNNSNNNNNHRTKPNAKKPQRTKTKRKEKRNSCHFHLFFNSVFILPSSRGGSWGFIQGMLLCAGKRRSCLPLFQGLITPTTPEKRLFSTKDVIQYKKIPLTVKASYT